jgi:hypothetical protein
LCHGSTAAQAQPPGHAPGPDSQTVHFFQAMRHAGPECAVLKNDGTRHPPPNLHRRSKLCDKVKSVCNIQTAKPSHTLLLSPNRARRSRLHPKTCKCIDCTNAYRSTQKYRPNTLLYAILYKICMNLYKICIDTNQKNVWSIFLHRSRHICIIYAFARSGMT